MAWESVLGAVAGPLISSIFQSESAEDVASSQAASAREQGERNAALQREFAQHGIRWRVEDAKAAGLHPLYALSGGGAAFAPNPIVLPDSTGQRQASASFGSALEKGLAAFFSSMQKKDEVIAAAAMSNAALAKSAALSSVPFPGYTPGSEMEWGQYPAPVAMNLQNAVDVANFSPAAVLARRGGDVSLTPGAGPGGSVHMIAPGLPMILPSSQSGGTSEALEALSESWELAYAFLRRNVDQYGDGWWDEAVRYFPLTGNLMRAVRLIERGGEWLAGRPGDDELRWKDRHAVPYESKWVGRGPAPWNRGPTVSGRIRR